MCMETEPGGGQALTGLAAARVFIPFQMGLDKVSDSGILRAWMIHFKLRIGRQERGASLAIT